MIQSKSFIEDQNIKDSDLKFLILDVERERKLDGQTWIKAMEKTTNTPVTVCFSNSKEYNKDQIRELLINTYHKIKTENSSKLPEIGEIL